MADINEENMIIRKSEAMAVKKLGESIGYGNLMEWASALWRKDLKDHGLPIYGAFIPTIGEITESQELYDAMVTFIFD